MDITDYQKWVSEFYKKRNWYQYNSFIRSNFLSEEVGELAQAIRNMKLDVTDLTKPNKLIWKT